MRIGESESGKALGEVGIDLEFFLQSVAVAWIKAESVTGKGELGVARGKRFDFDGSGQLGFELENGSDPGWLRTEQEWGFNGRKEGFPAGAMGRVQRIIDHPDGGITGEDERRVSLGVKHRAVIREEAEPRPSQVPGERRFAGSGLADEKRRPLGELDGGCVDGRCAAVSQRQRQHMI